MIYVKAGRNRGVDEANCLFAVEDKSVFIATSNVESDSNLSWQPRRQKVKVKSV
ncbi:MAG: hypothetical protein ACLR0B_16025 [Anaerobutyricum soehngenii]